MLPAAGGEVDAGSLDGGMTEDVGKASEVVGLFVVTEGEEPPQVVGKDAAWVDAGGAREGFQTGPRPDTC